MIPPFPGSNPGTPAITSRPALCGPFLLLFPIARFRLAHLVSLLALCPDIARDESHPWRLIPPRTSCVSRFVLNLPLRAIAGNLRCSRTLPASLSRTMAAKQRFAFVLSQVESHPWRLIPPRTSCARAQLQQSSALLSSVPKLRAILGGSYHLALPVLALSCSKAALCFLAEPRGVAQDLFFDGGEEIKAHYRQATQFAKQRLVVGKALVAGVHHGLHQEIMGFTGTLVRL